MMNPIMYMTEGFIAPALLPSDGDEIGPIPELPPAPAEAFTYVLNIAGPYRSMRLGSTGPVA